MTRDQRRRIVLAPLVIWAALLALLLATALYAYLPGAPDKLGVSLSIGVIKAVLIGVLFMQLWKAPALVRLAAIAGLVWASFLYLFAFADYLTR